MSKKSIVQFERIYVEHKDNIYRVCTMYLRDRQLAEDATQDTFYRALCKLSSFHGKSDIKTWLTRIAINICKDRLRRNSSGGESADNAVYDEENIDDRLTLTQAIETLPTELREVIILYYYQELTLREISELSGTAQTTVSYRLKKARQILKNFLTEDEDE